MRRSYPGYYEPTKEEFDSMWETCLFVLDTNVVLDLFRKSREYSEQMFLILEEFSTRLWIPHQVGLEYRKRLPNAISEQTKPINKVKDTLEGLAEDLRNTTRHPFVDDELFAKIATRLERYSKKLTKELEAKKKEYLSRGGNEAIEKRISKLFGGKIGRPYCAEKLREIYEEWKKRHDEGRPLCRKERNGVDKYGDLVIWFQLIDKAKGAPKPIIFITNDSDWLQEKKKGKTPGPHPDLINEMDTEAGVQFYVYRADKFMEYASRYLKKKIPQEVIEEAQEEPHVDLTLLDVYKAFQIAAQKRQAQLRSIQRASQEAVSPAFVYKAFQELLRAFQTQMSPASEEETNSSGPEEEDNNHPEDQID